LKKPVYVGRVLITDGHYKQSLALARLFHAAGFEVHTIGERFSANRFSKFWVYHLAKNAAGKTPAGEDGLLEFLSKSHFDLLVPVGANSVFRAANRKVDYLAKTRLIIPDPRSIELAFDKFASANIATQLGIGVPRTLKAEDWLREPFDSVKSYIVKNRRELGDRIETQYFKNGTQVTDFLNSFDELGRENLIVQERIQGVGEAFFAFYLNGILLDCYTHARIREIPTTGGSSTCARTTDSIDVRDSGERILKFLNWNGPAMVEFKRELDTNDLFLMEINPKYWGSLDLGVASGFNPIEFYSEKDQTFPQSSPGSHKMVKFQWPFNGDFSQISDPKVMFRVVFDFLNPMVKKNINLKDPIPLFFSPFLFLLRRAISSQIVIFFRMFYARCTVSGIKIALQRSCEEIFGIPFTNGVGKGSEVLIGPQISKLGKLRLRMLRIENSISLQSEFDDVANGVNLQNYLSLPCREYAALTDSQLLDGVETIQRWVSEGSRVYIHCREGVSRAAYLAIAYEASKGKSIRESIESIKRQRSFINPLPIQIASIESNLSRLREIEPFS
jgi:predicted ATP-grasp superfamily ATP-dependent carboligase